MNILIFQGWKFNNRTLGIFKGQKEYLALFFIIRLKYILVPLSLVVVLFWSLMFQNF